MVASSTLFYSRSSSKPLAFSFPEKAAVMWVCQLQNRSSLQVTDGPAWLLACASHRNTLEDSCLRTSHSVTLGAFHFVACCSFCWGWLEAGSVPSTTSQAPLLKDALGSPSCRSQHSSRLPARHCADASSLPWEARFSGWEDNSLAIAHSIFSLPADAANRSAN